jgi:predicted RNA-binding Zn ribbon-like protein
MHGGLVMAATIIETEERHDDETQFDSMEPQEEYVEETPVEATQEETEDDIPEKYQGKSVADIVRMHQEAEKLLGRQSSEVGELRKVVDSYIQTQLSNEAPETEEIDFFDDPQTAVSKAIENHPKIKEAEAMSQQYRKQDTFGRLQQQYPDLMETVQDPKFQEWVKASKIRTQLYMLADQQFDYDSANELLSNWNERKGTVKATAEAEKASRKNAVKEASTGNVRGTGETSKKIYRRSDIIKLMKTDPDRYQALSDEIMTAYREGRVK